MNWGSVRANRPPILERCSTPELRLVPPTASSEALPLGSRLAPFFAHLAVSAVRSTHECIPRISGRGGTWDQRDPVSRESRPRFPGLRDRCIPCAPGSDTFRERALEAAQRAPNRRDHPRTTTAVRPRNPSRSREVPLPEFTAEHPEFPIFHGCERSRYLLHSLRMALAVVAVLAATSLQDSEPPYRIIIASRTLGGASIRTFSASMAASVAEACDWDEDVSE